jgi:hypothetical protein
MYLQGNIQGDYFQVYRQDLLYDPSLSLPSRGGDSHPLLRGEGWGEVRLKSRFFVAPMLSGLLRMTLEAFCHSERRRRICFAGIQFEFD